MSYTYWTADLHLSAKNTIEYCNRPFKDINHMNEGLIKNINDRVKPEDTLMHIGDFFMLQNEVKHKPSYYESLINCNIVHIMGNHDWNNSVKGCIESAIVEICGKTAWVIHIPPREDEPWIDNCELSNILHVSTKTLYRLRKDNLIPYTMLGNRPRYLPSQIYKALRKKIIKCDPKYINDFYQNYINNAE